MGQVIPLQDWIDAHTPHIAGTARCYQCGHLWEATAPMGTSELECPECQTFLGLWMTPIQHAVTYECDCGCDVFRLTPTAIHCYRCGEEVTPYE